jgi:MOSC domain-containing protein YiiM
MTARIVQVSISPGGVPKLPVPEAEVTAVGLIGDGHNEPPWVHGGIERALCLWSLEVIEALNAEGHRLFPGAAGENVTISGLDWARVEPGSFLKLGETVVCMVTRYTTPCRTNARWFAGGDFNRMHQNLFPGSSRVYARVIEGGVIRPGDPVLFKSAEEAARALAAQQGRGPGSTPTA